MKRLTETDRYWEVDEFWYDAKEPDVEDIEKIYNRLAAIEDILCDGEDEYDLERLAAVYNQRVSMRDEVSQRFSLTAKIPLDRLREIAEAERDGRCVVLPRLEPGRGDPAGELGEPGPAGVPWSPGRHETYNNLIKWLRTASGSLGGVKMSNAAADALAGLQAENVYMRKLLHRYCNCKVCANAADPYGLHCKFGGCNGGGDGAVEEDRWQLRPPTWGQTR